MLWARRHGSERVWATEDCRQVSGALKRFSSATARRSFGSRPRSPSQVGTAPLRPRTANCGRLGRRHLPPQLDSMHYNYDFDYGDLLRWVPSWVMLEQAKLMLEHLSNSPTQWPDNAIYAHSAISA